MAKTGCLVGAALLLVVLVLGGMAVSQYNGLVSSQQAVEAQWAQVESAYQRRAELLPNLEATVRGSAQFERDTLREVVEARSRVGQVTAEAGANVLADPQAFARSQAAQDQLSSALSRLLVVVERYPELRTTQAFRDFMSQIEGTENRINVERRRFNEVAQGYNSRVRRVPAAWLIGLLGWDFAPKPYFQSKPGAETAPRVDFGQR